MKSDAPSTATLWAGAEDKQTQSPGSNGSFQTGRISMGTGAVSGAPMFLPRKEYNVDPPHHSMDHGPVGIVKQEKTGEVKKKRRSMSDLFKRKGDGKSESETEVYKNFAKHGEDREAGPPGLED
ncbi:MAG: hypothetical protein Q9175_005103 [Cornicularia normoerica]